MVGVALYLNEAKTEAILFSTSNHRASQPRLFPNELCGRSVITMADIRDLGVHLYSTLSMTAHVSCTCRTAYAQIRCIPQIRSALTHRACKTIVQALGTSRFFENATLYGITGTLLHRIEMVQRSAARRPTFASP